MTRFQVRRCWLENYEIHTVGSGIHKEYWIPADELNEFNENIVGAIQVIRASSEKPRTTDHESSRTTDRKKTGRESDPAPLERLAGEL